MVDQIDAVAEKAGGGLVSGQSDPDSISRIFTPYFHVEVIMLRGRLVRAHTAFLVELVRDPESNVSFRDEH